MIRLIQAHLKERWPIMLGLLLGGATVALVVGQTIAQTASGPTDPKTDCVNNGYKWCTNQDGNSGWCTNSTTGTCPAYTESDCAAQSGKWCKNSDGATGWCSSDSNYRCPANTESECTAQSGKWCKNNATTAGGMTAVMSGWCSSDPNYKCPAYTENDCTAQSGKWCKNSDGATGWCSSDTSYSCPAYNETDCKTQGKIWCVSPNGGSGWCTDNCPYTTTSGDPQTTCASGGGKWCKNSDGSTGWCSSDASYKCPAYTESDCTAQSGKWCKNTASTGTMASAGWCSSDPNYKCPASTEAECVSGDGEWCTSQYGGTGWCNSVKGSCPISDKVTCASKGRTWCQNSSSTSGWCAMASERCPSDGGTTTPATVFSWPNGQTECESYYGVWCSGSAAAAGSMYSGYCTMAGKTCFVSPKPGSVTCWDRSEVLSSSICPAMPTTESDCTKLGKNWCRSSYASTSTTAVVAGYCSPDPCETWPPAGKMTCPDGKTFVVTLADCPKKSTTVVKQPSTQYIVCLDGTKVVSGSPCPKPVVRCRNGDTAESMDKCPPTIDNGDKPSPEDLRRRESDKQMLLREIETMGRGLKGVKDETLSAKLSALKEKVRQVIVANATANELLRAANEELDSLRDEYRQLRENLDDEARSRQDREMQERAMKQMKQGMRAFERFIASLERMVKSVESKGLKVDASFKDNLQLARSMMAKVKDAKTYEDVQDMVETMPSLAEELNDQLPKLEQLAKVPQILKLLNGRIVAAERAFKQAKLAASRLKFDSREEVGEMEKALADAKSAVGALKNGATDNDDLIEYVHVAILEKLDDVFAGADRIKAIANLRLSINRIGADIAVFGRQIKRAQKRKEDVSAAVALLSDIKTRRETLRAIAAKRLTPESGETAIETLRLISDASQKLRELLKLESSNDIGAKIKRALGGNDSLQSFRVEELRGAEEED